MPGVTAILRRNFDLPLLWRDLRDDERNGRFCELHKRRAIGTGREKQFPGNFRAFPFGFPNGLPLANGPTRLRKVHFRQRGSRQAAAKAEQQNQRQAA